MNKSKWSLLIMLVLVVGCEKVKKEYYENGSIKKIYIEQNGMYNGNFKEFYSNGNLCIDANYKAGKLDGLKKVYNIDGKINWSCNYKDNLENGIYQEYSDSGYLKMSVPLALGKKNGLLEFFYKNGQLSKEVQFKNGIQDGIDKSFFRNGKLRSESEFQNNQIIFGRTFDANGKVIENDEFRKILVNLKEDSIKIGKGINVTFLLTGPPPEESEFYFIYTCYMEEPEVSKEPIFQGKGNVTKNKSYLKELFIFKKNGYYRIRVIAVMNEHKIFKGERIIKVTH